MPFGTFLLLHRLHLCCLRTVIVVPVGENLVDHVCLYLCLACSWLKLHSSPLEHLTFAIHCLQSWDFMFSLLHRSSDFHLMVAAFERRSFDPSSPDPRTFRPYSSSVYSLLVNAFVQYLDCAGQMWSAIVPIP